MPKKTVLFVCIHNSARSQMAEEILRKLAGERYEVVSAGLEPGDLNPLVVAVLKEMDIDISAKETKSVFDLLEQGRSFDYVITVCDAASGERCPVFPGANQRLHWGFEDPSGFAGNKEERLAKVRAVKDQIYKKIEDWLHHRPE